MNFIKAYNFKGLNCLVLLFIFIIIISCLSARGATFVVSKTADTNDGTCNTDCSLREAIEAANAAPGNDDIGFDMNVFGDYQVINLTIGPLSISNSGSLTINGPAATLLTIDSGAAERHFNILGGAVAAINRMTLSGNRGRGFGFGGGIDIFFGTVTLNESILVNNSAQHGGAIRNGNGILRITNSTLRNNQTSAGGGAILNSGNLTEIINTTITGNVATSSGGGLYNTNGGTINISNSTIAKNTVSTGGGGGVDNTPGALEVNVRNSIIADNSATSSPDFRGTFTSQGYNLLENTAGAVITGVTAGNIFGQDPQLMPLGTYGGSTESHALSETSPAIDASNPVDFPPTDQRGAPRPQDGDLNGSVLPDIGAYERSIFRSTVSKIQDTNDGLCNADCSLREAVVAGNANHPTTTNEIYFDQNVFSTPQNITLTLGLLSLDSGSFVIKGPGANLLNISSNRQYIVFRVQSRVSAEFNNLTVSEGLLGIYSFGTVTLNNSAVRNNGMNGGIYVIAGNMTINNSVVQNNESSGSGAGIRNSFGSVSINNSTISGNRSFGPTLDSCGGGIYNFGGQLTVTDSLVSGNLILNNGSGGGICAEGDGRTTVSNSVISNNVSYNRVAGGIYNKGAVIKLDNVSVDSNSAFFGGGGIYNAGGTATITKSSITYNRSAEASAVSDGGGIYNTGILNLTNSTVSRNITDDSGGGLYNQSGTVNLNGTTFAFNTAQNGGGVFNYFTNSSVYASNSLFSDNRANGLPQDFSGTLISQGYNLIENTNQTTISGTNTGNITGVDPQLLPLNNYGGLTNIHPLSTTSLAIDKGNSGENNTDQRGQARPYDNPSIPNAPNANGSDIGAFERRPGDPISLTYTAFDFDGDGKTDVSIFRPSTAVWWYLRSGNNQGGAAQLGAASDKIVPADFTGDGKTDLAVFRESTGQWFVLRSEDNSFYGFAFGTSGDKAVPADFDGDGKADPTVFRPSNGNWYSILSSNGTVLARTFGVAEDVPLPADFDGDGKADLGVFRPSTGVWWSLRSGSNAVLAAQFGTSSDKPTPADFTGDGKVDFAFWRPSTGFWYVIRSEDNSFYGFPFGTSGDTPAVGDYDGDGRADASVFRNSNATWYLQRSTSGFTAIQFGTNGDKPVPSAYLP